MRACAPLIGVTALGGLLALAAPATTEGPRPPEPKGK
jgi:hypothetical protein